MKAAKFWETKTLGEMSHDEWEAICDGCARCCLIKLEDCDDGTVYFTDIACKLLNVKTCRCTDYPKRVKRVPSCVQLSPERIADLWMMPPSCSYRRMAEGRGLADWHHLICGNRDEVHHQKWSVKEQVTSENLLLGDEDLEDRLVDWPVLDQPVAKKK